MTKNKIFRGARRFLSLVLVVMTVFALHIPASAAEPSLEPGCYIFYTINGYTCMNVGFAKGVGASIVVDHVGTSVNSSGKAVESNEIWIVERVGNTAYFTLRPWHNQTCLLTGAAGFDKGLTLTKTSGYACHWKAIPIGDGKYNLMNRKTGLVIDVTCGNIDTAGTKYLSYERNNFERAQGMIPVRVSTFTRQLTPVTRTSPARGLYSMRLYGDRSMAVNAQYAAGVGANIVCDPFNNEQNEIVELIPRGNNLYSIHFQHKPDLCLAPSGIRPDDPLTLKAYKAGDPACLWEVYKVGSGYSFRNVKTLLMADDFCCQTATGTKQIAYSYNNCTAQVYYLEKVTATSMTNALYKINTSSSKITCGFDGYTKNVAGSKSTLDRHEGIDFAYGSGKAVYSLTDGVIKTVNHGTNGGLSTIAIYQASTNKTIVYLHTAPLSGLKPGQYVSRGQKIATEASRGAGGTHTHVEVRNGELYGAAKSLDDPVLNNSNPASYWASQGYRVS